MRIFIILSLIIACQDILSQNTCLKDLIKKTGLTDEKILLYEKSLKGVPIQIKSKESLTLNSTLLNRSIILNGGIDKDKAGIISSLLLYLDTNKLDTIKLYINSPGGSVYSTLEIYDIMQMISSPIKTIGYGICASSAVIILCSGAKCNRLALPDCHIMMHKPSIVKTTTLKNTEEMNKITHEIYTILSKKTGKEYHQIEKDCQKDYWFTPQEAAEYGLIDYVIK